MNPTTRTLAMLRQSYPLVEKVEHWVAFPPPGHRKDLFGLFDIVAIHADSILAVQATSWGNVSARLKKMRANPFLAIWCGSEHRVAEVWGWRKSKKGGRWEVKRVRFMADGDAAGEVEG